MKFTSSHALMLEDIMTWRRDTRHFRNDPLPEDEIKQLCKAMDLAPSVGNARPWRVIRVDSQNLRDQIKTEFEKCNQLAAAQYQDEAYENYVRLKLAGLDQAPLQLAIFTEHNPEEGHGLGRQTMPNTLEQSTVMAIYSLWLAARARNIGVGMLSILEPRVVERIFDVPENWQFTSYLCIGRPEFDDDTPLLHCSYWQKNTKTTWQVR